MLRRATAALAVFCFLIPLSSSAQTARLTVLSDSVSAGLPFGVAVTVSHAPGAQVTFPSVPTAPGEALRLGDAEALSVERFPPAVRGAVRVDSVVIRALVFEADSARVGPLVATVTAPGDTARVRTGAVTVPVRSVLAGEAPPYEPAPVGPPEAFPSAVPLWVALGVLGLALVGVAAWGIARSLRRGKGAAAGPLPYPAAVAALGGLDRDAPAAGASPEAIEAHVVAIRAVLRGYLADRLGVPAREATTAELAGHLGAHDRVSEAAAAAVARALTPTDVVAFARVRPGPPVVARLRDAARAAVEAVEGSVRATAPADSESPPPPP